MYDVTFEELVEKPIREPADFWTIFSTAQGGIHVATYHDSVPAIERRELQRYVTAVLNGRKKPNMPGVWSYVRNHALAYNGYKKIVISTQLPLEVRDRYLSYMLHVLNNGLENA